MSDTIPKTATGLTAPEEVSRRLKANLERRGYLLPHQGLMAIAMPRLQDGYQVMYKALTLDQNQLTDYEKEFVWLAVLAAAGEHIGTHHVKLFLERGGDAVQAEVVFHLVGLAAGALRSYKFLDEHWERHFPPLRGKQAYWKAAETLIAGSGVSIGLARLALLAVHTTLAQDWGIEAELEAAYAIGVHEGKLAEAACLPMWATGMNRTIDASQIWLDMIRAGRLKVSEPFRVWADTDQGAMPL
ncbi:MAG: hypothetical protein Q8N17_24745 [Burkholderiaceae bacterium]|nr:hypothetical protein [Burkholderiaceae bacterium]